MSIPPVRLGIWGIVMTATFPRGRGSALTPDQRREIQRFKFVDGLTISEISRRTARDRGTVADLLRDEDSQALRAQLETDGREAALQILRGNNETAARGWIAAIAIAAESGNHKPAKDLLLHNGVIQPLEKGGPMVGIQVIVGSVDQPAGPDPFEAIDVTPNGGR